MDRTYWCAVSRQTLANQLRTLGHPDSARQVEDGFSLSTVLRELRNDLKLWGHHGENRATRLLEKAMGDG